MDKKEERLKLIQSLKHDFSKLVPTTIELMFDACIGIVCEEFALKNAELDALQKKYGNTRVGLLRAKTEREFQENRQLLHRLKTRVMAMYSEVQNGKEGDKKEETFGKKTGGRSRKPSPDGESST